jgi:hypothetical protein
MIGSYFPILVPIIGIFLPGIAMISFFVYKKERVIYKTQHFFSYKEEPRPE